VLGATARQQFSHDPPQENPVLAISALHDADNAHPGSSMRPEARRTVSHLHSVVRLEQWIRCARAELASCPDNELLREFIRLNEQLLAEERDKIAAQIPLAYRSLADAVTV
jgi:hypothetical protein